MPVYITERTLTKVSQRKAEKAVGRKIITSLMEQPGSSRKIKKGKKTLIVSYEEYPGLGERPIREFWLYEGL